jgi:hypothetical protein
MDCFIECVPGDHVGEGDGDVASGCDYERVGVVRVFQWWEREVSRCCADKFYVFMIIIMFLLATERDRYGEPTA